MPCTQWGLSQESASCKQQIHELRDSKIPCYHTRRLEMQYIRHTVNNLCRRKQVPLQQNYHFNKFFTQQVSHFNKCITSTSISLQQVSDLTSATSTSDNSTSVSLEQVCHFNKCLTSASDTSTSVSLNKCLTQQVSHFNNCLTQQVSHFNKCFT